MSTLPTTSFTLTGGCFCSAIRYTISIPPLSERPKIHKAPKDTLGPQTESTSHWPIISIDHCDSCRRISGSIFETWLIIPTGWIKFSLLPKSSDSNSVHIAPLILEYTKGSKELLESTHLSSFKSSEDVYRTFCGRCGTHLTYDCSDEEGVNENPPPHLDVALGTLDKDCLEVEGVRPTRLSWAEDGVGWIKRLVREGEGSLGN